MKFTEIYSSSFIVAAIAFSVEVIWGIYFHFFTNLLKWIKNGENAVESQ